MPRCCVPLHFTADVYRLRGAALVAMSADRIASYVVAGLLILGMLVALVKSDNLALRVICLCTVAVVALFLGLDAGGWDGGCSYACLRAGCMWVGQWQLVMHSSVWAFTYAA